MVKKPGRPDENPCLPSTHSLSWCYISVCKSVFREGMKKASSAGFYPEAFAPELRAGMVYWA